MAGPKFTFKSPLTIDTSNNVIGKVKGVTFTVREFFAKDDTEAVLSIGQNVSTASNVQFANVTSSNLVKIGNIFLGDGFISSSNSVVAHTGSIVVSETATFPSMNVNGKVNYNKLEVGVTGSNTIFKSGSSIFGDDTNDKQMMTGSFGVTGSLKLNGYQINELSNDTSMTDGSSTSLPTENAVKTYLSSTGIINELTYLRKSFAHTGSITNSSTASFNAITASAPSGLTTTSEDDFMFFVNGMMIESDALTISQKSATNLELRLNTSGLGYSLESGDEVIGFGKFNN
jgi:hypothetical protein|tara:strand:+ start:1044 stop:1904 length:861 start_codon:yes stop_codon:yes gene_type:complete